MPSSPIDVPARHSEHVAASDPWTDLPALAEVLDTVPDPRSRRGRRYRLGPLPALPLLAILGGATSIAAINRPISGYDPSVLSHAGLPDALRLATSTLRRLLARLDGDAFDTRDLHLPGRPRHRRPARRPAHQPSPADRPGHRRQDPARQPHRRRHHGLPAGRRPPRHPDRPGPTPDRGQKQ